MTQQLLQTDSCMWRRAALVAIRITVIVNSAQYGLSFYQTESFTCANQTKS